MTGAAPPRLSRRANFPQQTRRRASPPPLPRARKFGAVHTRESGAVSEIDYFDAVSVYFGILTVMVFWRAQVFCAHPAALCEAFLPFGRAMIVYLSTRLDLGRLHRRAALDRFDR